jgi:hypothetical protein
MEKKKTSERLTLTVDCFSDDLTSPLTVRVAAHPGILNSMGPPFFFAGPALSDTVNGGGGETGVSVDSIGPYSSISQGQPCGIHKSEWRE